MTGTLHATDVETAVRAVADRARAESVRREREGLDLADLVADLLAAGIGRLRVPARFGGAEAGVDRLAALLVELSAAESSLTQIVRGHLGFVELLLQREKEPAAQELLAAAGRGELFGPAASSRAATAPPDPTDERPSGVTLADGVWLHDDGDGLRLSGAKYYTTGSLYADWINVLVVQDDGVSEVVISRHDPGVSVVDDWNGFGQRFTTSGTATFDAVPVREDFVLPHDDADLTDYLGAFYQLVHSATQAGIARRVCEDAGDVVRRRRRTYPLAGTQEVQHDPQVLGVVGEIASRAVGARAAVQSVALLVDEYLAADGDLRRPALDRVVVESAATQVLNSRLAGEVGWLLFDAASASALDLDLALDRHWRNARTVSSHNPSIYKARLLGEHVVNGTLPVASLGPKP